MGAPINWLPSHLDHAQFYAGTARWRASLSAIVTPLIPLLDADVSPWPRIFWQPYAVNRHVPAAWLAWLQKAQDHRCFWCGGVLSRRTATVEHVLPYGEAVWRRMARVEQLVSLRVSHSACNTAYAAWRREQPADRLVCMDDQLVRILGHTVQAHPIFQLGLYRQGVPMRSRA